MGTRLTCLLDNDRDIDAVLSGTAGSRQLRGVLARLESKQQALIFGHAVPMPVVVHYAGLWDCRVLRPTEQPGRRGPAGRGAPRGNGGGTVGAGDWGIVWVGGSFFTKGHEVMQNKYVGDIGDFANNGLLRWLCGKREDLPSDRLRTLSLGVVWYLNKDSSNNDGGIDMKEELRKCDPLLFAKLTRIRRAGVVRFRQSGILPSAQFYEKSIVPPFRSSSAKQVVFRKKWLSDAMLKTWGKEIIFLNPDKGIASVEKDPQTPPGREHTYVSEIRRFTEAGKSLVAYHHAAHVSHEMQLVYLILSLKSELGLEEVRVLSFANSPRFYFLLIQPNHKDIINKRIRSFAISDWCRESLKAFNTNEGLNERVLQLCKP